MILPAQKRKAELLLSLHSPGGLLVLPNIWDPCGARILEAVGYPAVATASSAISASLGFGDGEKIRVMSMMAILRRITKSVDVPVTADIEAGYADTLSGLEETIRAVIDSGVVGINIEDSLHEGGALRPVGDQVQRIAAIRGVAKAVGLPLVINARIDTFVSEDYPSKETKLEEAILRAHAYAEAGADCVYPMGPCDVETLKCLRRRIASPLNVLAAPGAAPLALLREIGINRVSFGPYIFRSCMKKFHEIVGALRRGEGYECFGREMFSKAELSPYLREEREPEMPS